MKDIYEKIDLVRDVAEQHRDIEKLKKAILEFALAADDAGTEKRIKEILN